MANVNVNPDAIQFHPHFRTKWGACPGENQRAISSIQVLDEGEVALISVFGSDHSIAEAARVSYGRGTTKKNTDASLIRYLLRHRHTSPFEQAEVQFYIKAPIFVIRQMIRHRTANVNEYSARYSELSDDFYVPDVSYLGYQSTTNRQGRTEDFTMTEGEIVQQEFVNAQQQSMDSYRKLLDKQVSRELARVVTPVGVYTELYWKCDVHNFLHFLNLRMDAHAQREIRDFANAMHALAMPLFQQTFDAWDDYVRNARLLSVPELRALRTLLKEHVPTSAAYPMDLKMSDREKKDFRALLDELLS